MKTSRAARVTLRIRAIAVCLAVVATVGLSPTLADSPAVRWVQAAALQVQYSRVPSLSIGDFMVALR